MDLSQLQVALERSLLKDSPWSQNIYEEFHDGFAPNIDMMDNFESLLPTYGDHATILRVHSI